MPDKPQPDKTREEPEPDDEPEVLPRPVTGKTFTLEKPLVQSQDIEHRPREEVTLPEKQPPEDEESRKAREKLDEQYRKQVPG